jgi:hypothetical protein
MAAKEELPVLDDKQLQAKLQEVLQEWPLYRVFRYTGSEHYFVPSELSLFCPNPKCGKLQQWHAEIFTGPQKRGWDDKVYTCKNCGHNTTRYYFYWSGNQAESRFFKVGQHPPLQMEPPSRLAKKLNAVDADLYRKALTSRNNSYGLGALAYLRRVVENKMNDLLDLLRQAAQDAAAVEELKKIDEVKASWRFDDKIAYAAKVLPRHLKPQETNPLDALHDLASDGIHNRSEDDCLDIFDRCKAAFEYVFRELDVQIEDAKGYLEALAAINKKPAAAVSKR